MLMLMPYLLQACLAASRAWPCTLGGQALWTHDLSSPWALVVLHRHLMLPRQPLDAPTRWTQPVWHGGVSVSSHGSEASQVDGEGRDPGRVQGWRHTAQAGMAATSRAMLSAGAAMTAVAMKATAAMVNFILMEV